MWENVKLFEHAFECRLVKGQPCAIQVADWRWVTLDELDDFAFAVTDRKIIRALQKTSKPPAGSEPAGGPAVSICDFGLTMQQIWPALIEVCHKGHSERP